MLYGADYGGTDILKPLKEAIELDVGKRQKRIFLLTDGQDGNSEKIIDYIRINNTKARFYTFGLGDGCDQELL